MPKKQYNYTQVKEIITSNCFDLFGADFDPKENLIEIMDSLDGVALIMKLEEKFNIQIMDFDAEQILNRKNLTIEDLIVELKKYDVINIKTIRKEKLEKIFENQEDIKKQ